MAARRHGSESDDERRGGTFADIIDDVVPLGDRDRVRPPDSGRPARDPLRADSPVNFQLPDPDQPLLGYAGGIDKATFQRLRRGRIPPERSVDLHGLLRREARAALHSALEAALAEGVRCVCVIHGRGQHSVAGPVLKTQLPDWLGRPPVGARVLAFAPAKPEHGGAGATYVLLRRARAQGSGS